MGLVRRFPRQALAERLLASPYREADPSRADYFWLVGPNLRPGVVKVAVLVAP